MSGPQFTQEENELLVWLSYTTPRHESGPLGDKVSVESFIRAMAHDTGSPEASAYLLLVRDMPEKYPHLQDFRMNQCEVGKSSGFQGISMVDDSGNSIVLFQGSDAPSVTSKDWQGHAASALQGGVHPQQREAMGFYESNKAKAPSAWTYVAGHSLGGGLTLAVLVKLLADGRDPNAYGYIENSADFNQGAWLAKVLFSWLPGGSVEFEQLKQRLADSGRLRMASTAEGELLSTLCDTDDGEKLKGYWKDFGHNRDRSFLIIDVDLDKLDELRLRANALAVRAEAMPAVFARLGAAVGRDVREHVESLVTPENPLDAVVKAVQLPGRLGALVLGSVATIVNGGGASVDMACLLAFDPHVGARRLRQYGSYFGQVAQDLDQCDRLRGEIAASLEITRRA